MLRRTVALGLAALIAFGLAGCACTPHVTDFSAAQPSASTVAAKPVSTNAPTSGPIRVEDVRAVLASFERPDPTYQSYALDAAGYSASIIAQGPVWIDTTDPAVAPSTYGDPSNSALKALSAKQAATALAEAVSAFRAVERSKGASAAVADLVEQGATGGSTGAQPTRTGMLLSMLSEPLMTTGFMSGLPAPGQWSWKLERIQLTGDDSARVYYRVAAPPGAKWAFSRAEHVKALHFARSATGKWILDGWPNYAEFERTFRASVTPASAIPDQDLWWESIGQTGNQ